MLDEKKTLPAKIKLDRSDEAGTTLKIVLTEGRNRQIRRVAQQLGYQVQQLHRIAIGAITLDIAKGGELASGKYRHLKPSEINFLKNSFKAKFFQVAAQSGTSI